MGLPEETYDSYLGGIDKALSESIFEQLYYLSIITFPNTMIATLLNRKKFGIESRIVPLRYTKSKVDTDKGIYKETVEIVVGTSAMNLVNGLTLLLLVILCLHYMIIALFFLFYNF